ncbi:hypothetical protein GCM10023335_40120 [Streptomyces siamensis]|uniref:Uncharacterized protein n=1 Tax=Streptomyces siamensis TaxID=1274986 RepID=A0ABP9J0B0_9ACTN
MERTRRVDDAEPPRRAGGVEVSHEAGGAEVSRGAGGVEVSHEAGAGMSRRAEGSAGAGSLLDEELLPQLGQGAGQQP